MLKSILITGVSSGIGYDASRFFLSRGWRVFGSVRNPSDAADLESPLFHKLVFDVTDSEAIARAADQVKITLNDDIIDVLVNNAGIAVFGPLMHLPISEFQRQLEVNLTGVLRVTQAFLPMMGTLQNSERPGRIINIGSVSGLFTTPMLGPYCVSKYGLESMSDAFRRELQIYKIPVSIIEPASTKSDIWAKAKAADSHTSGTIYERVEVQKTAMIEKTQRKAIETERISKCIWRIAKAKSPRARYLITRNNIAFKIVTWLPSRWIDYILKKTLMK